MDYRYLNPPAELPANVLHCTFFSRLANHEVGFCVYLPPDYASSQDPYPVIYHLHGYQNHESTELSALDGVLRSRRAVTVFPNYSLPVEDWEHFPLEAYLLEEVIPHVESRFRVLTAREGRSLSGFSMGGGLAFCFAVRHPELFSGVTAYAGTYHHYFDQGFLTVDAPVERAEALRRIILENKSPSERNVLHLLNRQADHIRGKLAIELRVGTKDILYCDNEIAHLHLCGLQIPHTYEVIEGAAHELRRIV